MATPVRALYPAASIAITVSIADSSAPPFDQSDRFAELVIHVSPQTTQFRKNLPPWIDR